MNLQVENLETHEARLTISVDAADVEKARRATAQDLGKQIRIPGFRPGKAPMNQIIAAMGGEAAFMGEVANKLADDFYPKALAESGLAPYGPGQIEEVKPDPYTIIARVPLEPVILLNDYNAVRVPAPEIVVSEAEIDEQLEAVREENAVIELAERPSELGDLVEATVTGKVDDKEVFRSAQKRGIVLDTVKITIPGLASAMSGLSAGEVRDTQLVMPDDYADEDMRGKTVDVHISMERVSSRRLPELNDELAQAASSFSTLAEMREDIQKQTLAFKQRQADQAYSMAALDAFTDAAHVQAPPAFVEDRLNDLIADHKADIRQDTGMPFEEYLKITGKDEATIREELRPEAARRGKRGLVMREVGLAENIQVTEEDIAQEVEATAMRYGSRQADVRKMLASPESMSSLRNNILSNKVLARMMEIAKS